jgi:hypothetical protein
MGKSLEFSHARVQNKKKPYLKACSTHYRNNEAKQLKMYKNSTIQGLYVPSMLEIPPSFEKKASALFRIIFKFEYHG